MVHGAPATGAIARVAPVAIVLPPRLELGTTAKVPSGSKTLNVKFDGGPLGNRITSLRSSLTLVVVEPVVQRPDRETPARTGSAILIRSPGRTVMPAAISVAKLTTSVSFCWVYNNHSPTRRACPWLVQANALTSALTTPNLSIPVLSSMTSYARSRNSMSKY